VINVQGGVVPNEVTLASTLSPPRPPLSLSLPLSLSRGRRYLPTDIHSLFVNKRSSYPQPLAYAGARAPRGGVIRQGVVLTDLLSLLDCQ